ncbi:putative Endonuclease/exonuclease/phosphatase superfamily [Helianthus anomalus]
MYKYPGSVSVRFQFHETSFCFVCCHLASGGREGDERTRNSNAAEILSRTCFPTTMGPSLDLPKKILDHEYVRFTLYCQCFQPYIMLFLNKKTIRSSKVFLGIIKKSF